MTGQRDTEIRVEHCADDAERAERNRQMLDIDRHHATRIGRETLEILETGEYTAPSGRVVLLRDAIARARGAKVSLPPGAALPDRPRTISERLAISVCNETTLEAANRLASKDAPVLALNFAASCHPGGGFLKGARAQEEALARSSALYATLEGDEMYAEHNASYDPLATDWAILSPDVPVFRTDDGTLREDPWNCTILTCAAPRADKTDPQCAADVLRERIGRVLEVARAYGYRSLVLGAWGCGAFHNDPLTVAQDFRDALLGSFLGDFEEVVFAITDWSPERHFLGPFRQVFNAVDRE